MYILYKYIYIYYHTFPCKTLREEVWDKNYGSKTIGDPHNPSHPFAAEKFRLPSGLRCPVVYDQSDHYWRG